MIETVNIPTSEEKQSPMANRFRGFLPVVVDVETGGFNAKKDALLEIAAVIIGINEEGKLFGHPPISYAVQPAEGLGIDPEALKINKIDPFCEKRDAVEENLALRELFKPIRQAIKSEGCKRAVLVGHNANFDLSFVNAVVERNNIKRNPFHPFTSFDTATLAGIAYGQTVLKVACDVAKIEFSNKEAHSAAYDTEKTAELFCQIANNCYLL